MVKLKTSFLTIFSKIVNKFYDNKYHTRKHSEITYFSEILNLLYTCPYWNRYNGKISGKYLNKKHNEYIKNGIYNSLYSEVLKEYIRCKKHDIFKYISTDTSFIVNKYCTKLKRNKFYKSKKGLKVSAIVDAKGIPLSLIVENGNVNDSKIFNETYNELMISTNANKYKKSNRHKQYFLADKGYSTKNIESFLKQKGYEPIIAFNKRNIKDKTKIKKFTKLQNSIYKKRIVVENYFAWLKQYPKLTQVYESSMTGYLNLVYLVTSFIISNRMCV
jgi:transposase